MVQSRWKWVLLGVVLLLIAAEFGLKALTPPTALVRIVNRGDYPITGLVISTGTSRTGSARIEAGQSEVFRLSQWGKSPLLLKFTQFNNPLSDFELPEFEPRRLHRERSVLVLEVRGNEIVRYQEPDETPGQWDHVLTWARNSLDATKTPPESP